MYKKRDARAKFLFCLVKLLLFFLLSRRRCILNFLLFTIHCDPSETKFSQCKFNCSCWLHPKRLSTLRYSLHFWLGKLGERTGQLRRENSRRIRTHEKNSRETVCWLDTIIQSIFCVQSGASIRLNVWKWSGESRCPGAFRPVLENFRRAFSLDPSDRPWVSEDGSCPDLCCDWSYQNKRNRNITSVHGFASLTGKGKRSHFRLKNVAPEPYSKQGLWLAGQTIGMVT